MPDEAAVESLREEVRQMMSNPEHKMYSAYQRNDPSVGKYLDDRYKEVYGSTETVDLTSKGFKVGGKSEEEIQAEADQQEITRVETELKKEWGPENYETNMEVVTKSIGEVFRTPEERLLFDKLGDAFIAAGGDNASLTKLWFRIAQRMNGMA